MTTEAGEEVRATPDTGDEERLARVALSRVVEPGDERVGRLVAESSAAEVWSALLAKDLQVTGVDGYQLRLPEADPHRDLERAAAAGIRVLVPGDDGWPDRLDGFGVKAPLLLWVRGEPGLDALTDRSVAVVGARAATDYGEYVAAELAADLADRGWTVVSGGAYGIDARAHRGALAARGSTVAVLACGVDVAYPRGHETLFAEIARRGLIVGELPPGCTPTRFRFLERNRMIAGLTAGVVVVEAAVRSGAANTARWAERLGRPVMAVPGPVTSSMSAGCHVLLRSHTAECVTDAAEVIEVVGRIGADLAPVRRGDIDPREALPPEPRTVLEAVPARGSCTPDRLARLTGVDPRRLLGILGELESDGWVDRDEGGWCLGELGRARRRPPAGDTSGGGA
ncbi:MAG: DNA-processing protein DprA [Streptosporangiales bacterium]|nr:DNA-processing protein DprA [Streptosporangiales bacterium]MBO0891354.1 DNA-processing protein DprA [Acidothermales bacterium]